MQKLKYFIKIFYNNKQVSRTSVSPLQFDFKVMFQQIFNIQLIYWPETICLEVCRCHLPLSCSMPKVSFSLVDACYIG
jgi:hypothetical protein